MKVTANFDVSINFIPFCGVGIGYQKTHRSIDIIMLIPFIDIQLKYNFK